MKNPSIEKAKSWASDPYLDTKDREEIQSLIDRSDVKEIEERFYKDLEFGTGGLRSILGVGANRMNKYNVRKATQALCNVVKQHDPNGSVAISYDSRNFSEEFSKEVACVVAGNGLTAYLYSRLNPVCLLSFSTRYHNCSAGVMVTASHNPPEYNGYKAYWSDGKQVTPPYDGQIIESYKYINDFQEIQLADFNEALSDKKIVMVGTDIEDLYYEKIYEKVMNPQLCKNSGKDLKIVFTPIHGTGLIPCKRALNDIGFDNLLIVEEQAQPDGNFPTVKSPNPENPDALALAVELMNKENADIVFGTDPDTDRLGVALSIDGKTVYLNGNQIGVLMLHYILENSKNNLPSDPYMIKTIVTTRLQDKIAKAYGLEVYNTLTGFKWICTKINELEKSRSLDNFIFATEESFGYLNHPHVRDKDGVSSVILMAEVALHHKKNGKNLPQALDDIYSEFGLYQEELLCLDYFGKEGAEKISRIMSHFRENITTDFAGENILAIEDYQKGKTFHKSGSQEILNTPASNVLGLMFESGNILYLRPSGTEPKIKFYIMTNSLQGSLDERKTMANNTINKFLDTIKETCKDL